MEKLVYKAKNGNKEALEQLINKIYDKLYKIAFIKLKVKDDAEDVVQNTMELICKNIHNLREDKYFETWAIRILINECNKKFKNLYNKTDNVEIDNILSSKYNIENINDKLDLKEILAVLDKKSRGIMLLYLNQYSSKEIADIFEMNENTVKTRIKRTKEKIKRYYKVDRKNGGITKISKTLIIILVVMLITTGLVYASISIINNYLLKSNSNQGILDAIDNGYIQEVEMEKISSNGIKVSVNEILMDDFSLLILFNVELPEYKNIELINDIQFCNFVITDENDNVIALTLDGINEYEEFYTKRNIQERNQNIAFNKGAYYGEMILKSGRSIEYKYSTYAAESFPRSKKLTISFDKIIIYNKKIQETKMVEGNWKLEVDLPENMYNREIMIYNVQNSSKDDIKVTEAQVSNTAMKFELVTKWGNPVFTENDSEEEKRRKKDEFFDNCHSIQNRLIQNEYVENEKGERFYPVKNSSDANGGYNQMFDGTLRYWQTFNLTQYNATDTLKVVFDKQGEKVEIILHKKGRTDIENY